MTTLRAQVWRRRFALAYLVAAAWLLYRVASVYDPSTGLTPLMFFGDHFAPSRLARLRDLPIHTYPRSTGYDGQFYGQIAVAGNPFDPELRTALDSTAYRDRRILMPAVAHIVGLGRPAWALGAYAWTNVVCWVLLAWAAARWWFPPENLHNLVRWVGTMLGAGMVVSVGRSLTDGPSLLVIAAGVRAVEGGRRWLGAGVLAAAGLARETSVLAAGVFVPPAERGARAWRHGLLAAALVVAPTALWIAILSAHFGSITSGALGLPGTGFARECRKIFEIARGRGLMAAKEDLFVVVATVVQVAFLLSRQRPGPWWRVGAAFAVLAFFLGWGFWDDALSGVPRTLLPLALAFNVLAPRTRRGLALLLAGNLTVLSAATVLDVVPRSSENLPEGVTAEFGAGFYALERSWRRSWRWSSGPASLRLHNPNVEPRRATLEGELLSETDRSVTIAAPGTRQVVTLPAHRRVPLHFGPFPLPAGDTTVTFDTAEPPWPEPGPGGRALAFSLRQMRLGVTGPGTP